jgi:NTE family protein
MVSESPARRDTGVAIVLPGGGARGAYEIGALSVLLPALEARGERPAILCGTSVGGINAAVLASLAHLPAGEQVEAAVERWRGVRKRDILAPLLGPRSAIVVARLAGELVRVPGVRFRSLLDPAPLRSSIDRWVDWPRLHANVRAGHAETVCVAATAVADGTPVAFYETRAATADATSEDIRYVRARLSAEHVRASASIPVLFPPVAVRSPRAARGSYMDGATRLNTPIKPALDLGADRVIVVGFEPIVARPQRLEHAEPHLADIAANVMDGLLLDQVNTDLQRLAAVNSFFAEDGFGSSTARAARAYRESRGRRAYRKVPYAIVTPEAPRELGCLAERVFDSRYGGLRGLRDPDFLLLARMLGRAGASRGELLSFLLFDEVFIDELLAAGRRSAERWLRRHPGFWCADAAHDLGLDPARAVREREAASLEEWRALRRL